MRTRAVGPRSGATVVLDRERRVRYTLRAVEAINERFDINLLAGEQPDISTLDDVTWLTWLGLHHAGERLDTGLPWWRRLLMRLGILEAPELTPAHVADWLDMQNVVDVSEALSLAIGGEPSDERSEGQEGPSRAHARAHETEPDAQPPTPAADPPGPEGPDPIQGQRRKERRTA